MKLSKKSLLVVSVMLFALFFWGGQPDFSAVSGTERRGEYPSGHDRVPRDGGGAAGAWRGGGRAVRWAGKLGNSGGAVRAGVTVLIYLSIGPGLGIPRAASVPFEMAVAPYLPEGAIRRCGWRPILWASF